MSLSFPISTTWYEGGHQGRKVPIDCSWLSDQFTVHLTIGWTMFMLMMTTMMIMMIIMAQLRVMVRIIITMTMVMISRTSSWPLHNMMMATMIAMFFLMIGIVGIWVRGNIMIMMIAIIFLMTEKMMMWMEIDLKYRQLTQGQLSSSFDLLEAGAKVGGTVFFL